MVKNITSQLINRPQITAPFIAKKKLHNVSIWMILMCLIFFYYVKLSNKSKWAKLLIVLCGLCGLWFVLYDFYLLFFALVFILPWVIKVLALISTIYIGIKYYRKWKEWDSNPRYREVYTLSRRAL